MQFFMYTIGDENDPRLFEPPTPEVMAEMTDFMAEATSAGALVATGGFGHSAQGARVSLADGEFTVTDGPFAEAKELIGGWALVEVSSLAEAIGWARRFLVILGGGETRIRPVLGGRDPGRA